MDRSPAPRTLRHLPPTRDPTVTSGRPCHWTCDVAWVNEHQDQADKQVGGIVQLAAGRGLAAATRLTGSAQSRTFGAVLRRSPGTVVHCATVMKIPAIFKPDCLSDFCLCSAAHGLG